MAMLLAGFWFGGVSLAGTCTSESVAKISNECYGTLADAIATANENDTVMLLKDIDLTENFAINVGIKLDLWWNTVNTNWKWFYFNWNHTSEISNWTIVNNTWNVPAFDVDWWANVTIKNWTYSGIDYAICVEWWSTLTIENAIVNASRQQWITVRWQSTLVIEDGTFTSKETTIAVFNWSNVIINWWTYTAKDNFLVAANWTAWVWENTITINSWTFNANIESVWYIACWIYAPNNDTVNVNWWTFNVTNWVWVVVRWWTVTISSGVTFNVNGSSQWKVWDANVQVPAWKDVVMDIVANYPWSNPLIVTNNKTGTFMIAWTDKNNPDYYTVSIKDWENVVPLILTRVDSSAKITQPQTAEWYQRYNWDETIPYNFDLVITEDVALVPRINTYTIKFDANAEWIDNPADEVINHWAVAAEPQITNTGYVLLWWFKDDSKYDFSTPVTESFTLTWKWEALSDPTWTVEDEDFTWVVLVPEEPKLSDNEETTIELGIASSNSTATMEWVVEVTVYSDNNENGDVEPENGDVKLTSKVNFTTARLVRIPVNTTWNVVVKVRHTGQSGFTYEWLTTSGTATCSSGKANPAYNGELISPTTSWYVEIYTCSASTFVAYTETKKESSSSSSAWWGGWSSKSDTKTETWTTNTTVNTQKDNNDIENTSDTTAVEDLQKVLDDGYTVEFHNAYNFAFKNWITTMPNIEEADMNSPLTRIAMAKMLSQYAINILGKAPDTTKTISFPDVSAELDTQYNNGVTLAYQLWIMGIWIDEFRPFDLVTRAEFVTALSRMLYWLADGENLYYETHMQKLLNENIITVANPNMHELRWYVMIMLMRSAENK